MCRCCWHRGAGACQLGKGQAQKRRDNLSLPTDSRHSCSIPYQQPQQISKPLSRFNSFSQPPLPSPPPAMAPCSSHASALRCIWEPELHSDRTTAKPLHPYSPPRERQVICAPKVKRSKLHQGVREVSITAREGTQGVPALDSISPSASLHSTE